MRVSEAFESKYLKATDLQGRQVKVAISSAEMEQLGDPPTNKLILYFQGKEKGMVCNLTNAMFLADALGDETDNWVGQEIVLYSARVMFKGKATDGLRVKLPPQQPTGIKGNGKQRVPSGPSSDEDDPRTVQRANPSDLDDSVPF